MSACPRCGSAIEEGKAYCSNPSCGAVLGPAVPAKEIRINKEINLKLTFDFVKLARAAAAVIALLAAAFLYFFAP